MKKYRVDFFIRCYDTRNGFYDMAPDHTIYIEGDIDFIIEMSVMYCLNKKAIDGQYIYEINKVD